MDSSTARRCMGSENTALLSSRESLLYVRLQKKTTIVQPVRCGLAYTGAFELGLNYKLLGKE